VHLAGTLAGTLTEGFARRRELPHRASSESRWEAVEHDQMQFIEALTPQRLGEERLAVHNAALAGQLPEHPVARVKDVDDSETVPEPATFLGVLIESFAPEAVSDKLAAVPDVT
jgi:hypothetical protein